PNSLHEASSCFFDQVTIPPDGNQIAPRIFVREDGGIACKPLPPVSRSIALDWVPFGDKDLVTGVCKKIGHTDHRVAQRAGLAVLKLAENHFRRIRGEGVGSQDEQVMPLRIDL